MKTRYCPTGNHMRSEVFFAGSKSGRLHRDCIDCEVARANGNKTNASGRIIRAENPRFPGVDIDRIHYKLGAVRKEKVAA